MQGIESDKWDFVPKSYDEVLQNLPTGYYFMRFMSCAIPQKYGTT